MKRLTDEEIQKAVPFDDFNTKLLWDDVSIRPLRISANAQFQADKKAVERGREKIAKVCSDVKYEDGITIYWDDLSEYEKGLAYEKADEIIKLILENKNG